MHGRRMLTLARTGAPPPRLVESRAPERAFTAGFVGENNMLAGRVVRGGGTTAIVEAAGTPLEVATRGLSPEEGQEVTLSIRSECVTMTPAEAGGGGTSITGTYAESVYLGLTTSHLVRLSDGTEMISRVIAGGDDGRPAPGTPVRLSWQPSDIRLHVE